MNAATGRRLFVTGTDTDIGKTVACAILCQALGADYWKPVQCGDLDHADSDRVRALVTNEATTVHPEGARLEAPMSPHAAAALEQRTVRLADLEPPAVPGTLVIEGAGGLLVPLNDDEVVADAIASWGAEVVVVSRTRLGSINHTLLTLAELERRGHVPRAIIFSGDPLESTESAILRRTDTTTVLRIPESPGIDAARVATIARTWNQEGGIA